MPAGVTAEARLLGHDAVVVRERHDNVWPQQLLESIQKKRFTDELQEHGISTNRLPQPSRGPPTFSIQGLRCAGIIEFGFVLDITLMSRQIALSNLLHRFDVSRRHYPPRDKIAVALKGTNLLIKKTVNCGVI